MQIMIDITEEEMKDILVKSYKTAEGEWSYADIRLFFLDGKLQNGTGKWRDNPKFSTMIGAEPCGYQSETE